MAPTATRVMAIDYGEKRIGLAVSDPTRTIASPLGFLSRRAGQRVPVAEIARQAHAQDVGVFVVGLALDLDGRDTPRSTAARTLAQRLAERTNLPTHLVDERFTTAQALQTVRELGGKTRGRKGDVDALAATILLQHALSLSLAAAPGEVLECR